MSSTVKTRRRGKMLVRFTRAPWRLGFSVTGANWLVGRARISAHTHGVAACSKTHPVSVEPGESGTREVFGIEQSNLCAADAVQNAARPRRASCVKQAPWAPYHSPRNSRPRGSNAILRLFCAWRSEPKESRPPFGPSSQLAYAAHERRVSHVCCARSAVTESHNPCRARFQDVARGRPEQADWG